MLRTLQQYFVISDVIAYVARTCYNAVWRVVLEQCSWKQIGQCALYTDVTEWRRDPAALYTICVFVYFTFIVLCYCVTVLLCFCVLYCSTVSSCIVHMVVVWIQQ